MVAYALELRVLRQKFSRERWKEPLYFLDHGEAIAHAARVVDDIAEEWSTTKAFYGKNGTLVADDDLIGVRLTIYPIHIQEPVGP